MVYSSNLYVSHSWLAAISVTDMQFKWLYKVRPSLRLAFWFHFSKLVRQRNSSVIAEAAGAPVIFLLKIFPLWKPTLKNKKGHFFQI